MIIHGDSLIELKKLEDNSVDSIVTDPPYGLSFMGKKWDYDVPSVELWKECLRVLKPGGYLLSFGGTRTYHRMAVNIEDAGFEIRDQIQWLYGSGFPKSTRINRFDDFCQCALEKHSNANKGPLQDAVAHTDTADVLGGDVPQRLDAQHLKNKPLSSQAYCLESCDSSDALSQTCSKADLASFPPQECVPVHTHSVENDDALASESLHSPSLAPHNGPPSSQDCSHLDSVEIDAGLHTFGNNKPSGISQSFLNTQDKSQGLSCKKGIAECIACGKPNVDGWGTALKPANEPICMARKPLSESTVAKNVLKWGTGGINVDATRIRVEENDPNHRKATGENGDAESMFGVGNSKRPATLTQGRFPANLILDEEAAELLDAQSGTLKSGSFKEGQQTKESENNCMSGKHYARILKARDADSGGASRFFYCAKSSKSERNAGLEGLETKSVLFNNTGLKNNGDGTIRPQTQTQTQNHHPTVKPLKLMRYLCRLITQPGGLVLDPFAGSGSTGVAALQEGFRFQGIEREVEYITIAERRIKHADAD